MNEKTKRYLEDTLVVLIDRAEACPADSEDYFRLMDRAEKIGNIINKNEEINYQKDLDEQKFEFEKTKYEESKSWMTDWKFWVTILVPVFTTFGCKIYDRHTLMKHTREINAFEKDNTYVTYAGKQMLGSLRLPQDYK